MTIIGGVNFKVFPGDIRHRAKRADDQAFVRRFQYVPGGGGQSTAFENVFDDIGGDAIGFKRPAVGRIINRFVHVGRDIGRSTDKMPVDIGKIPLSHPDIPPSAGMSFPGAPYTVGRISPATTRKRIKLGNLSK
ncbi:hypothetical protein A7Q10_10875 [Methylacidiphilum caldifontis]|uniref:Uncharacterized protein n=1 Tax=Methylacidiphilum caldifontis TaxID=2795386 RepID=A0A4Y8PGQ6_9BACT|nr:hypothetical protein A7Q10_10875 [Methylacidiphilum caldifontis]